MFLRHIPDSPSLDSAQRKPTGSRALLRLAWMASGAWLLASSALGHNLDQKANYLGFDQETLALFQSRSGTGQPLYQVGDTIGLVLKATPVDGTPTGAGGFSTFFVPIGTQVVNVEYGYLDVSKAFVPLPVKGQSPLAIGDGGRGSETTSELIGLQLGPNVNGQTALAVNASGLANGTLAGVYSDTGIFYSTDPRTAWQSWVTTGGLDGNTSTNSDNALTSNSGDVVIPSTRWDAEQLIAFGIRAPINPIIDYGDGRGNTPWGMGSPVAGPESGYAWAFDKGYWDQHGTDPARMKNSIAVGPWKRIQYSGSLAAKDTPGTKGTTLGFVGADATAKGYPLSLSNPLPVTTSWTDNTSPKAVRIAWGNLEIYRPEYARMQIKIINGPGQANSAFDAAGFLQANADTFGGDAGGEYNNLDHPWRYYNPTTVELAGQPFVFKQVSKPLVQPGESFSYTIWVINFSNNDLSNVQIKDTLPSGLQFINAVPAQTSGPNPLVWSIPTLPAQTVRSYTVNVRSTGTTGALTNVLCSLSSTTIEKCTTDVTVVSSRPLVYPDKSVTPDVAQPGNLVSYTITLANRGTAATPAPMTIREMLPSGFTFSSLDSVVTNGNAVPGSLITTNSSNPTQPIFTINKAISAGNSMNVTFRARISPSQPVGNYCNSFTFSYDTKVLSTGPIACVNVVKTSLGIGNLVFFDANGDGHANAGEGVAGVTLELYQDDDEPGLTPPVATTITDSNGRYLFDNVDPGTYFVRIPPSMFQVGAPLHDRVSIAEGLFGDDDVGEDGLNNTDPPTQGVMSNTVFIFPGIAPTGENGETGTAHESDDLSDASVDLTVDFGFQSPMGIGNLVFIDANNNGHADPGEGVEDVVVQVFDANTGVVPGEHLFQAITDANGHYLFNRLGGGDYIIHIPVENFLPDHPLANLLSVPDKVQSDTSDDNVGEDGIDQLTPALTGISSRVVHLVPGHAPLDAVPGSTSGEAGYLAGEDGSVDADVDLTIDFGFTAQAPTVVGVGNLVFLDANYNQHYDVGEGVGDVVVQLFPASVTDPLTTTPLRSTVTTVDGGYFFGGLPPGDYLVFIPPSNFQSNGPLHYTQSITGQGGDNGNDDDFDENGDDPATPSISGVRSTSIHLQPGTEPVGVTSEYGFNAFVDDGSDDSNDLTVDFGFFRPVGVGNLVFKDSNGNGHYDVGEGVSDVIVQLFAEGKSPLFDLPLVVTTTSADGRYSFKGLKAGRYFLFIPDTQFYAGGQLANLRSIPDLNSNSQGDDDVGEDGLDTETPQFSGIYTRVFTLSVGGAPTDATTEHGAWATDDNANDPDFDATIDFGFYDPGVPVLGVGNRVFIDTNHNGLYDTGEGVGGVTVQLMPAGQLPTSATPLASVLTNSQGSYLLTTNTPGDYLVYIPASEFAMGKPLVNLSSLPGNGSDDGKDDDQDENGVDSLHPEITGVASTAIHLAPGTEPTDGGTETGSGSATDSTMDSNVDLTVDFGFYLDCPTMQITPGTLAKTYLTLPVNITFGVSGGTAPFTWSLLSGSLPAGLILDPAGQITGTPTIAATSNLTVQVTDTRGCIATTTYQWTVSPLPQMGVGNAIYIDANHNKYRDPGEGVANVEVELFAAGADPLADPPLTEIDTDAEGLYRFDDLAPGQYFIYIPPSEFGPGKPLFGCISIPGVSSDDGIDDDLPGNDNGIDSDDPATTGISSVVFTLTEAAEPIDSGSEKGFDAAADNSIDANFDATIDLGFREPCPTLSLLPAMLPKATAGFGYSAQLSSIGGTGVSTFAVINGTLPQGITMSAAGLISGTSSTPGSSTLTIRVTDEDGCHNDSILTLEIGNQVSVGNLIFFDANANGHADAGEGVAGVTVQLYRPSDTPGTSPPAGSAVTDSQGRYLINHLAQDTYMLHVPKTMFAPGSPLCGMKSRAGSVATSDDDVGEDGLDAVDPTVTGVSTDTFVLTSGASPSADSGETGLFASDDDASDSDVDLTRDFGFVDSSSQAATFTAWTADNHLAPGSDGPGDNPDGDSFSNLLEYALGMNPGSGAMSVSSAFQLVSNGTTGGIDARIRRRHGGLADTTFSLEGIASLSSPSWTVLSPATTVINNCDGTESVTFSSVDQAAIFQGSSYGFIRLRVNLDANHDNTAEATSTSIILGWQRRVFTPDSQTFVASFAPAAVFCGKVDAVVAASLDVTTSAGSAGIASLIGDGREYEIEVTSGSEEGQRWDVNPATTTATAIGIQTSSDRNTMTTLPTTLVGNTITLRPHWRVADLFPVTQFIAETSPSRSDNLYLWNSATNSYLSLWLLRFSGNNRWRNQAVASPTNNENNHVVPPASGVFVKTRSTVNCLVLGELRTWKFNWPLTAGINFVGNPFPVAQSPSARQMSTSAGFTGTTSTLTSDKISVWKPDTGRPIGYDSYNLIKGPTIELWKLAGGTSTNYSSSNLFSPGTAAFVNSIVGKSVWMLPAPQVP